MKEPPTKPVYKILKPNSLPAAVPGDFIVIRYDGAGPCADLVRRIDAEGTRWLHESGFLAEKCLVILRQAPSLQLMKG
jgi:hypothetical protein